jgi:hypothetical protein
MSQLTLDISMSLDGYVAGRNQTLDEPLGERGDQLHEWAFPLKAWREPHGLSGGETNPSNDVVAEGLRSRGATVMGRTLDLPRFGGQFPAWAQAASFS